MIEKFNYISDEELEQLILQVEQEELVPAPPDLMENILETAGVTTKIIEVKPKTSKKKEFYAYCFRVITSVAAAVALVFLLPEMTDWMGQKVSSQQGYYEKYTVVGTIPEHTEVVRKVPDRETIVATEVTPTKEEVLNSTGLVERFIQNTNWFSKDNK